MTARLDLLSEFDFIYQDRFGFRVSGAGWYDAAYEDLDNRNLGSSNHLENGRAALGQSDETDRFFRGPSGEILDAFVFGKFDVGSVPVNVKLGRHTVFWGEAMLNPVHSTSYGQSALDLGKLFAVPGTEAKELFLPREAISMQVQATPELSFAGQYFFDWEQARIPESGSFLGFNDHLLRGGESFIFGPAAVTPFNPLGVNRLVRGQDVDPDKHRRLGPVHALEPAVARRHARRLLPRHRRHPAAGQRHPGGTTQYARGPVQRAGSDHR